MTTKQIALLKSCYQSAHSAAALVETLWIKNEKKEAFEPDSFRRLASFAGATNCAAQELANIEAGVKTPEIAP